MYARATGLVLGFAADRLWGDPARHHPVAGFGQLASALEQRIYLDDRARGAAFTGALVGGSAAIAAIVQQRAHHPLARTLLTAVTAWAVLGGRSLGREASAVHALLATEDLPAARQRLTHLVGRRTSDLDVAEVSRATVESVAENTSDAVVAPLLAGTVAGVPGLVVYRAANTLDAMVGHRSARYEQFGWASARLDDLLNLAPSRLSATLAAMTAPRVGGSPSDALRIWRRDAARHPSPNAGPVEASFAGALGVRLGGTNIYGNQVENRAEMGDGDVTPHDIARAVQLGDAVSWGSLAVSVAWCLRPRPRLRRRR
ncbi:cobalamin biosynthesis protein [Aeromicrobium sp. CF3.5]|uniref:cobalamin biosynthesis protein n=1 Tax=Aeromicrobium sp. CF3.5 TaxID=3373078 RepID=UPI003EE81D44